MSDISPSSIRTTKTLEEQINTCQSQAEVQELLRQAAIDQNLVHRDWDPTILTPNEPGTDPKAYARAIVIDGTKHIVSGATEIELEKAVGDLYHAQLQPATTTTEQPARDASTVRFTSSAEPGVSEEQKAALSLQLQLGQIDVAAYLEQSGAIDSYLEKAGVPLDDLKSVIAEKQSQKFEQSWAQATEAFLQGAGANWPGGQENLAIANRLIVENGLMDQPSAETLAAVWAHMKQHGLAVESQEQRTHNREAELTQTISKVNDPYALRNMLQPSSGLFGR
jgi:hypothetical protein